MANKYPFIKAVSVILQIIWYLQWFFLFLLIVVSVLIATNSSLIDTNKIKAREERSLLPKKIMIKRLVSRIAIISIINDMESIVVY